MFKAIILFLYILPFLEADTMSLDVYTQNIPLTQKATVNFVKNYQKKNIEWIEVPKDCKGRKTAKSLLTRSNLMSSCSVLEQLCLSPEGRGGPESS